MSNLPKWVARLTNAFVDGGGACNQDVINLRVALAVAWEALEKLNEPSCFDGCDGIAKDAMRRIEEIGK